MPARPAPREKRNNLPRRNNQPNNKVQRSRDNKKTEMRRGIFAPFGFGIVAAIAVAAILTFLCQNGLAWTDRCNCSWEKVILYSVLSFVACVIHLIPYLMYREEKRQYTRASSDRVRTPHQKKMSFLMGGMTAILVLASVLIIFLLIPLFQDQNGNFLWFFTRGGGILAVIASALMGVLSGVFGKQFLAEHVV